MLLLCPMAHTNPDPKRKPKFTAEGKHNLEKVIALLFAEQYVKIK